VWLEAGVEDFETERFIEGEPGVESDERSDIECMNGWFPCSDCELVSLIADMCRLFHLSEAAAAGDSMLSHPLCSVPLPSELSCACCHSGVSDSSVTSQAAQQRVGRGRSKLRKFEVGVVRTQRLAE
jgi:hypothetical protein